MTPCTDVPRPPGEPTPRERLCAEAMRRHCQGGHDPTGNEYEELLHLAEAILTE